MAKKLLEEATVRRFMTIAGLKPLSESFVDTLEEKEDKEDKEDKKEDKKDEEDKKDDKKKMDENLDEMYKEEEPEQEPMDASSEEEVEMPDDMDAGEPDSSLQDRLVDIIKELADLADLDLELEGGEEEGGEEEGGEDVAEPPMEEEFTLEESEHMEEPPKDPAGTSLENLPLVDDADSKDPNQDPSEKEEEAMKEKGEHMDESKKARDQLVEQIAKRVAARLSKTKK